MNKTMLDHLEKMVTMLDANILLPRDIAMNLLRRSLGDRLLMYLLNLSDKSDLDNALDNLSLDRFTKLTQIMVLATPVLLENPDLSTVPGTFCRTFGEKVSLLDEIRMQNGGVAYIPPDTGDGLCDHLTEDAQRIFPTLLMTEWGSGLNTGNRFDRLGNFFQDRQAEFEDLLYQEKCIEDLLNDCEKHLTRHSSLDGLCVSTAFLPVLPLSTQNLKKAILSDAFYRANTLDVENDREVVNKAVKESLQNFRTLLSHGKGEVTCVAIFDTVRLLGNASINLGGGELRLGTDYEKQMLLPKGLDQPLVYVAKFDDELLGVGEISKIIEATDSKTFPQCFHMYKEDSEGFSWVGGVFNDSTIIQASIILANADVGHNTVKLCGQCFLVPYGFIVNEFKASEDDHAIFKKRQAVEVDLEEVKKWFDLLKAFDFPLIILRRLVIAFSERQNHEDAVLDLLIVLESLFGSSTETSFKLSLCIAKLLNPTNRSARESMFNQMKVAYDFRSKIVHGAKKNPKKHNGEDILAFLHKTTINLIKVLLTEKSDLLRIKSDKRINAVALL